MFVMLDADTRSVQERLKALDESLAGAGRKRIGFDGDPIARLVPKRNVETWVLFLTSKGDELAGINEDQDYKHSKTPDEWSSRVPEAAETLFRWTRPNADMPPKIIDSLRRGIDEIPRALSAIV